MTRRNETDSAYDGLGSTTEVVDGTTGSHVGYRYDPFGKQIPATTAGQPFRFTGEQQDTDVNRQLYYLCARYYDPALGRFWSKDPLPFLQRYAYVSNNPANLVDPWGLCGFTDPWNCGGEAIGLAQDTAAAVVPRNAQFVFGFVTGTGDTGRNYGPSSPEVRDLRGSAGAQVIRDRFVANGCATTIGIEYGTRQAFMDTITDPFSTATQVGGFAGASATKEGGGMMTIRIPNVAGTNSLFYHKLPNAPWHRGPFRTIHQTFEWTEPVPSACQN